MLIKKSKKQLASTTLKAFLAFEVVGFIGSYALWHRMNVSQDFRYYMNKNFPKILDGYYSLGETLNPSLEMRTFDKLTWEKKVNLEA